MDVSALGNVWYPAIMNSSQEVTDVANLAKQSACGGLLGIAGSRRAGATGTFTFDQYIASSSPGELCDLLAENLHF